MIKIDLAGKIALVTGATGELGRVMVRTLAKAGANVVVHYHKNQNQAEILLNEIDAMGQRGFSVQADVTQKHSVDTMRDRVNDVMGSPDILITSAVVQYEWVRILDQPIADYESQFRSSVLHNVLMAQAFFPDMIKKGWGRMIGINTECSVQCGETQSAYVSGKRGMDGVLRVLAREEGGHGITVNQVAPGWTISENRQECDESEEYRKMVPLKRRGTDQEIANVVAFLASDLANFVSGVFLPVCGGNVMPGI